MAMTTTSTTTTTNTTTITTTQVEVMQSALTYLLHRPSIRATNNNKY